jgi:hypothetical protein
VAAVSTAFKLKKHASDVTSAGQESHVRPHEVRAVHHAVLLHFSMGHGCLPCALWRTCRPAHSFRAMIGSC